MVGNFFSKAQFWWTFFKISINERLVYRGDFALGTLFRFLPIITQIYLWWAVFESVAKKGEGTAGTIQIEKLSLHDVIGYFLLVFLARAFSSMPGLTGGIARSVQNGEVKKYLTQPVDMIGCLLVQRVAHKLVYYLVAAAPFALVFFLCRDFFDNGFPGPTQLAGAIAALMGAFLLGFFIEACLGLFSFWFLEVTSLAFVYMLLNFFLSGHMFPLDLLPESIGNFVGLLPFQYLAYFPAMVCLGKIEGADLANGLLVQYLWIFGFIVLSRVLWSRGLVRYGGYGG